MMPSIHSNSSEKSSWLTTWTLMMFSSRWSWTHGMSHLNSQNSWLASEESIHHSVRVSLVPSMTRSKIKCRWLKFKQCWPTSAEPFLTPLIIRIKCLSHFTKRFIRIIRKTFSLPFWNKVTKRVMVRSSLTSLRRSSKELQVAIIQNSLTLISESL